MISSWLSGRGMSRRQHLIFGTSAAAAIAGYPIVLVLSTLRLNGKKHHHRKQEKHDGMPGALRTSPRRM
jgi:hypothetical protein